MLKEHLITHGFLWGPETNPYGVSGFMVYPPAGKKLKSNIENEFRKVFQEEGFEEIETPVLYPKKAWEASGHLQKFGQEMFHTQTSNGLELVGRSEMATTIYPLFRELLKYYKGKMPFKVCQMGIVLPNDRQTEWETRTRQYTSHEGHIFFETNQIKVEETVEYLRNLSYELMKKAGINSVNLSFRQKCDNKPFYATKAYGLYTPSNKHELELLGIQYRSSTDFEKHSKMTKFPLKVKGEYPEVFEISFSTDRPFLTLLEQSFKKIGDRTVLQLPDYLAPIPLMIFPLTQEKNIQSCALEIKDVFAEQGVDIPMLPKGTIGNRYKRADAIGVPYVLTFDQQSITDKTFTIRDRDTQSQVRIDINDITNALADTKKNSIAMFPKRLYQLGLAKKV